MIAHFEMDLLFKYLLYVGFVGGVLATKAQTQDIEVCLPHGFTSSSERFTEIHSSDFVKVPTGKVKIPVVIHVFHDGDSGRISMEQAKSGLAIINRDFNGLNDDFNNIDPRFDSIKSKMNIEFSLARIDPNGNKTSGIIYHEDRVAAFNRNFKIYDYSWDNFKYLNIYLPIYSYSRPSLRTAYATLPSTNESLVGRDGIVHSSVRWGVGEKSELEEESELLSIATHEVGHWLNLNHTFSSNCNGIGDSVDDTPPTLGDSITFSGCKNFDFSCGVPSNGSNYMNYNHGCKKMFTKGQVNRMLESLVHPSRVQHWSLENLIATGLLETQTNESLAVFFDNREILTFLSNKPMSRLELFDHTGRNVYQKNTLEQTILAIEKLKTKGLILYRAFFADNTIESGRIIAR